MNAVCAANLQSVLVLPGQARNNVAQTNHTLLDQIQGIAKQEGKSSIDHVIRRNPKMHKSTFRSKVLLHIFDKRHYIVARLFLQLCNALQFKAGIRLDLFHILGRNSTKVGPAFTNSDLDIEPSLRFGFCVPDGPHLRARVTFDQ